MQIIYLSVLSIIAFIIIFLIYTIKNQPKISRDTLECGFRITKPKIKSDKGKKNAYFSVLMNENHRFFMEFPILFRFYSDYKFKSKIRIGYKLPGDKRIQDIFDEEVDFNGKTREYKYLLTDIILGKLHIEIGSNAEYGNPIVCFEILENSTCKLNKEYKLEIKF